MASCMWQFCTWLVAHLDSGLIKLLPAVSSLFCIESVQWPVIVLLQTDRVICVTVQALLRDLLESPHGRLRLLQHQPVSLQNFLESVEQNPMASASIAQVGL